jgi:uncharacterized membrane protein
MAGINQILLAILWLMVIVLSGYFLLDNVVVYFFGYRSSIFGNTFLNNQLWVVLHLIGGSCSILFGPIQFWKTIRIKYVSSHRLLGKIYTIGTLLAALSALRLSLVSSCVSCRISLLLLAIFTIGATSFAWITIKNKNVLAHQQFMVRSYVCVLAFVAVRIDGIYSLSFLFGTIEDPIFNRTVNEYFFSFVPLIITEIWLTWLPALKGKSRFVNS